MKLFEIADNYLATLDGMEIDEETGEILNVTGHFSLTEFNDKAINVSKYINNLQAEAKAIHEVEEQMYKRRKRLETNYENLKEYLRSQMERVDITEISCPYFGIKRKPGRISVDVIDESALPSQFKAVTIKEAPDKTAIKKAIEAGEEVPGARLIRKEILEIK